MHDSSLKPLVSCIAEMEFSLGLIKLRTVSLNLFTDTMFRSSSLSAHHSLIDYGLKDKLKDLVLPEKVFILFWHADVVWHSPSLQ